LHHLFIDNSLIHKTNQIGQIAVIIIIIIIETIIIEIIIVETITIEDKIMEKKKPFKFNTQSLLSNEE